MEGVRRQAGGTGEEAVSDDTTSDSIYATTFFALFKLDMLGIGANVVSFVVEYIWAAFKKLVDRSPVLSVATT